MPMQVGASEEKEKTSAYDDVFLDAVCAEMESSVIAQWHALPSHMTVSASMMEYRRPRHLSVESARRRSELLAHFILRRPFLSACSTQVPSSTSSVSTSSSSSSTQTTKTSRALSSEEHPSDESHVLQKVAGWDEALVRFLWWLDFAEGRHSCLSFLDQARQEKDDVVKQDSDNQATNGDERVKRAIFVALSPVVNAETEEIPSGDFWQRLRISSLMFKSLQQKECLWLRVAEAARRNEVRLVREMMENIKFMEGTINRITKLKLEVLKRRE